jgi:hypothetical protein
VRRVGFKSSTTVRRAGFLRRTWRSLRLPRRRDRPRQLCRSLRWSGRVLTVLDILVRLTRVMQQQAAGQASTFEASPPGTKGRVQNDYAAKTPNELSLKEGQEVDVKGFDTQTGWLRVSFQVGGRFSCAQTQQCVWIEVS